MKKTAIIILILLTGVCNAAVLFTSFVGGEESPFMRYRIDLQKRHSGVETMDNMFVKPQGAAMRRPGTQFIAQIPGTIILLTSQYPTLQELDSGDIPTIPATPADGAQTTPTTITTPQELQDIDGDVTADYTLGNDVNMDSFVWTPIVGFSGILEGAGFTISNLVLNAGNVDNVGMFSTMLNGAEVRNVNFDTCSFTADDSVGILCGLVVSQAKVTVKNCTFTDCTLADQGTAGTKYGLVIGYVNNAGVDIFDCDATDCTISCDEFTGGMVGTLKHTNGSARTSNIVRCTITGGSITATGPGADWLVGGMVGDGANAADGTLIIHTCTNTLTALSGSDKVGGIIGVATRCNITSCSSTGTVAGTDGFSGGLAGEAFSSSVFTNCFATGAVTSGPDGFVGGFVGFDEAATYLRCYATGAVTCSDASGAINVHWGGFAGYADESTHSRCWATGDVTLDGLVGNSNRVGGYVGTVNTDTSSFTNCYAWGSIAVDGAFSGDFGGFVGRSVADVNFTNVYAAQTNVATGSDLTDQIATDGGNEGGLIGDVVAAVDVTAGFYDTTTSGLAVSDGGIAHLTDWMMTKGNYTINDWDFDDIWFMTSSTITDADGFSHLISFEFSDTDSYVLGLGEGYTGFFRTVDGVSGQILDANDPNLAYYIATTYTDGNDLRGIHYVQKNDVMYLTHSDYPPQKLVRRDHADWTIADVAWEWGPFLDENDTTTTITPSGTTGSITLTASAAIFDADHVGALWRITEKSDNTTTQGVLDANESSSEVAIEGEGLMTLEGTWSGLVTLEKSEDSGVSWETIYPKLDGDAANIEYAFDEDSPGFSYRITMSSFASGSCSYTLVAYNSNVAGYVEITAFSSTTSVTAIVQSDLADTDAVTTWAEGSWSDFRGWPRAVTTYQNRLILAGNTFQPNAVWTSVSNDFENMRISTLDDGAIVYEVGSAKQNPILWLQDRDGIIAGTSGSIITIFSQSTSSTLTAATVGSVRQTQLGSSDMQAQLSGNSIIFVDRNNRKVHDYLVQNLESESFASPELSIFAEHITDPNVLEVAVQSRPDPILWYIKGDGDALTLSYNPEQAVVAWATHSTDGNFVSVAVIPGETEDEVWFIIERAIDGNDLKYVERLKEQDWGTDPNDAWFVDSGLEYNGVSASTITGLGHLEGELVQVFYDGNSLQTGTVSDSNLILTTAITRAAIGKAFTSTLLTFPIELPSQGGSSLGFKKKVYELVPSFYKTMYGEYTMIGQFIDYDTYDIPFTKWPDSTIGTDDPYTGQMRLEVDSGWNDEIQVRFTQNEPYPFNLTSLNVKIEVSEN